MATSYNGWPASRDPSAIGIKPFKVAGRDFPGGVKGGDVATVLRYVAVQWHTRVESLYTGPDRDDWGYSYRANVNNPSELSCHSSGTAIDCNASSHPNGQRNTVTYAQKQVCLTIEKECSGLVRWGGHFTTTDEMHWEIHGTRAEIAALAKRLRNPAWFHRTLTPGMVGEDVRVARKRLHLPAGTKYDRAMEDAVRRYRARLHLANNPYVNRDLAYLIGTPL
jgi:hypothetical protein